MKLSFSYSTMLIKVLTNAEYLFLAMMSLTTAFATIYLGLLLDGHVFYVPSSQSKTCTVIATVIACGFTFAAGLSIHMLVRGLL